MCFKHLFSAQETRARSPYPSSVAQSYSFIFLHPSIPFTMDSWARHVSGLLFRDDSELMPGGPGGGCEGDEPAQHGHASQHLCHDSRALHAAARPPHPWPSRMPRPSAHCWSSQTRMATILGCAPGPFCKPADRALSGKLLHSMDDISEGTLGSLVLLEVRCCACGCLQNVWQEVLRCVSRWELLQQIASGGPSDALLFAAPSEPAPAAKKRTFFSRAPKDAGERPHVTICSAKSAAVSCTFVQYLSVWIPPCLIRSVKVEPQWQSGVLSAVVE